jgi:Flp pilus assembly CpaF family ATPase
MQPEKRKNVRPMRVVDRSQAVKTNVGDSVNVVVHLERRPGRRFVSEVVEIHGYDPDRDEFNYGFIFDSHKELV